MCPHQGHAIVSVAQERVAVFVSSEYSLAHGTISRDICGFCHTPCVTVLVADPIRRVLRLQVLTIVWMTVECIVALGSAWTARSPALFGFGGDSDRTAFGCYCPLAF
jgi:hypothetical protein